MYKNYRPRIAFFSKSPINNFSIESIHFSPYTIVIPPSIVEKIKQSPIPQITSQYFYSDLLEDGHSFTDAFKMHNGIYVGFALYSSSAKVSLQYRISCFAFIFSGESLAVLRCVKFILNSGISRASIFTDSLSVIGALSGSGYSAGKLNSFIFNIKGKLHQANRKGLIILIWLPAHTGIFGN